MFQLPVTLIIAGVFALLMVALSLPISLRRRATRNAAADGGADAELQRRIRAHGNFIEYAPSMLLIIALMEGSGATHPLVASVGMAFLISRLLHAFGMLRNVLPARALGMVIQHLTFVGAGVWLVWHGSYLLSLLAHGMPMAA